MRPPATAEESSDSAPGPQTTCRVEEGVGWDETGGDETGGDGRGGEGRLGAAGRDGTRVEGREGWGEMEHPGFGAMRMGGGAQEEWKVLGGWGWVDGGGQPAGPSWSDLTTTTYRAVF